VPLYVARLCCHVSGMGEIPKNEPHVVIVGAGFGGLTCAKGLGNSPVKVTIIDRHNYHLFVQLLYQVATAALSPADIAQPIRRIFRRYRNIEVMLGEATGVDTAGKRVLLASGRTVSYDRLVIATGSSYSYFGHDEWAKLAPGPKTVEDALAIRARLLTAFEKAEIADGPDEQAALLTTVIVGGGPTGVEMAGAIAELARYSLARDFRHIDPRKARILLVEAGPRILPGFPEPLADHAAKVLTKLGVTVQTGAAVEDISPGVVQIGGREVRAGTVIWGAGVKASPAAQWLGVTADRMGRVPVNPDLSVPGCDEVYAVGDTALSTGRDGAPLPALAQVAHQQGTHLGKALRANLTQGLPMPPFRFRNRGNTAVIGRNSAVFDFGWWRVKGWIGWMLWGTYHIYLLTGFDRRLVVVLQWLWAYLTYQQGARLITEQPRTTE
jgi:NADH dehydrogenase